MCTNFMFLFQDENEIADMCTNFLVFLQEENEIVDMCSNVFFQEENEIADMCTNFKVFFRRRMGLQTCVLILLFFFRTRMKLDVY